MGFPLPFLSVLLGQEHDSKVCGLAAHLNRRGLLIHTAGISRVPPLARPWEWAGMGGPLSLLGTQPWVLIPALPLIPCDPSKPFL